MTAKNNEAYRRFYQNHREQEIERYKEYYYKNKEEIRQKRKDKYKNDPIHRFKRRLYSINKENYKTPDLDQINTMKHAIGWADDSIKNKTLKCYRNYYWAPPSGDKFEIWTNLAFGGYAKLLRVVKDTTHPTVLFAVTNYGIKYLEELFKIKIIQDEEDIVEA